MNQERLKQLKTMLEQSPNDSFLLYAIAQEYIKHDNKEAALRFFNNLLENSPEYTATYYHLGKLYESMGEVPKAIEIYKQGMAITQQKAAWHDHNELKGALALISDDEDEY